MLPGLFYAEPLSTSTIEPLRQTSKLIRELFPEKFSTEYPDNSSELGDPNKTTRLKSERIFVEAYGFLSSVLRYYLYHYSR